MKRSCARDQPANISERIRESGADLSVRREFVENDGLLIPGHDFDLMT